LDKGLTSVFIVLIGWFAAPLILVPGAIFCIPYGFIPGCAKEFGLPKGRIPGTIIS
jgi:hypothetical protein